MNILEEIKTAWGWTGIEPTEIVTENEFGNIIVKDNSDQFWRLCPEEVYCKIIAKSIPDYNKLIQDEEFMNDWFMTSMVVAAEKSHGKLKPNYKYHMVIPGILGGDYKGKNIKSVPYDELIRFSGDLGKQIKDLPEGSKVELKVI